ncbi:MAG: hypothetical protein DI535_26185 [Citrobacter freundii]|nr:MAG: hypothetical protein DI535_26185 [Citrobacter freundii]
MKHLHTNIVRIKAVHEILGDLRDKVVFIGGATVSLYALREARDIRETDDVDILVEIATNWDYAEVEAQLRKAGFENDMEAGFMGRFKLSGLLVDLMATDEKILGFGNQWYKDGFHTAIEYRIDDQVTVKIFDAPHFIASKIEAFKNRGEGDGRLSQDFEDIVFILENRASIWQEMNDSPSPLKEYLKKEFQAFADNPHIQEWIDSHTGFSSSRGVYVIMEDMKHYLEESSSPT